MFDRRLVTHFNWPLLGVTILLMGMGLLNLFSATSSFGDFSFQARFRAQLTWTVIGLLVAFFTTLFHYRHFKTLSYYAYALSLILLVLVLIIGRKVSGSLSWIQIGPFTLQPSEIAKVCLILALAHYFSQVTRREPAGLLDLVPSLIIFAIPTILVLLQKDLGTSLFFILIYATLVLIQGVKKKILIIALILGMVGSVGAYRFVLSSHQKSRIISFMNPDADRKGSGYHLVQSKIAVGSGGWLGKGYMRGQTHQLKFVPERHTDFIFTVLAEEWGFLGGFFVIVCFVIFLFLGVRVATQTRDRFCFFLALGISALFFWHMVINLGGILGLMPLTGVPLPLFSYGGSALLSDWIGIGLLLNISMRRFMFS
jgi:rod shape determining protein RodA